MKKQLKKRFFDFFFSICNLFVFISFKLGIEISCIERHTILSSFTLAYSAFECPIFFCGSSARF